MDKKFDLTTLLLELVDADIRFVVVGGVAAVLQGVPTTTFDLDVVHDTRADNVARIVELLEKIDARVRGRPDGQRLVPGVDALSGPGHQLLQTQFGALDLLGAIEGGRTYEELKTACVTLTVKGRELNVVGLEKLLELKQGSTHPKDRNTVMLLEQVLKHKESGG